MIKYKKAKNKGLNLYKISFKLLYFFCFAYLILIQSCQQSDDGGKGDDKQPSILPGVIINTANSNTSENGTSAVFIIQLKTKPTALVTINFTNTDASEGTFTPSSLNFTPENWNSTDHKLIVIGVDDLLADGNVKYKIIINKIISEDNNYSDLDPDDISIINLDNDTAGFSIDPLSGTTSEDGTKLVINVKLSSRPISDVSINIESDNTDEGVISPQTITLTPDNWNSESHLITVTGQDDFQVDGNQSYKVSFNQAVSTDSNYSGLKPNAVEIINLDDDIAGFNIGTPNGNTSEYGTQATFNVKLKSQPTSNVLVDVSSDDPGEVLISPETLIFTPENWNAENHIITATGQDDALKDGTQQIQILLLSAKSDDQNYNDVNPEDVTIENMDDDSPGFLVTNFSGKVTESRGLLSFNIKLMSAPIADVSVNIVSSDLTEGQVNPATIVFTPDNYRSEDHKITVIGQDDEIADGEQTFKVLFSGAESTDASYNGLIPAEVTVTNQDNDSAGFEVGAISGNTNENGSQANVKIKLLSKPLNNVTISVLSSDNTEGVVSPTEIVFTPDDWNSEDHIITVTGQDDNVVDGNQTYFIVLEESESQDSAYFGIDPGQIPIVNEDDDSAGFQITNNMFVFTNESGGEDEFEIKLTSQPTDNVTISFQSSNPGEGVVSPSSITFTTENWNAEDHKITVTGQDDDIADGQQEYQINFNAAVSNDESYHGLKPSDVIVKNSDNDSAGFFIEKPRDSVAEFGTQINFNVKLKSQPLAEVRIDISSSDLTEGKVAPEFLIFTPENWNAADHIITVQGQDDLDNDGTQAFQIVLGAAVSEDDNYDGLNPDDVIVENIDDESPGFYITRAFEDRPDGKTSEFGDVVMFNIKLLRAPTSNVTIEYESDDTGEGIVDPSSITITPQNYRFDVHNIMLIGLNDDIADGEQSYAIVFKPAVSVDETYNGLTIENINVYNVDNNKVGIIARAETVYTSEDGKQAKINIRLNSQPLGDVDVDIFSSDEKEGIVSPDSLTITPENWSDSSVHVVTVTGVDDFIIDGDRTYFIHVVASERSDDSKYWNKEAPYVELLNEDNEGDQSAGFIIGDLFGAANGETTERGVKAMFTLNLTSQPVDDVVFSFMSSDDKEGIVTPSTLTLNADNWNAYDNIVTITGQNDFVIDGVQTYRVVLAPVTSLDSNYNGLDPADITVRNQDDDYGEVFTSPLSGKIDEDGSSATFTVKLTSQPTFPVVIDVESSDETEASVVPNTLTFTPENWNITRTITVTGVDDDLMDGPQTVSIDLATSSEDEEYNLPTMGLVITNFDNEICLNCIYVDSRAEGGNNGTSWDNAFLKLEEAIESANAGDQIWVAYGTYFPGSEYTDYFSMKNGVAIYGGFDGTEIHIWERDMSQPTILSCNIGLSDVIGDNCSHVFFHPNGSNLDDTAILDGFTLTGGNATRQVPNHGGGAIYNQYSSPTIKNCIILENWATTGGGIYSAHSTSIISDTTFDNNYASRSGGGMYNVYSTMEIKNSTFRLNSVDPESINSGGGAIHSWRSANQISNSIFIQNSADSGGAILSMESTDIYFNNHFIENSAGDEGGAVFYNGNDDSTTLIANSVFWKNQALANTEASAIYHRNGNLEITNSTFYDNNAMGKSIMFYHGNLSLYNSVLWPETIGYEETAYGLTVSYSSLLDEYAGLGEGNRHGDPLFVDPESGLFNLQSISPCRDKGNNELLPIDSIDLDNDNNLNETIPFDIDGEGRVTGGIVDIGAYEYDSQ